MTELAYHADAEPSPRSPGRGSGASLPWERAATLAERLDSGPAGPSPADERSARRWRRWLTLPALSRAGNADDVLAPLGLGVDALRGLLGEAEPGLRRRLGAEPRWHRLFRDWWERAPQPSADLDLGLLWVVGPLLVSAQDELRCRCAELPVDTDPDRAEVLRDAAELLVGQPPVEELATLVGPTMVLELNVARVEGRLAGNTGQERYQDFVAALRRPELALEILSEYPVLARLVITRLDFWIERSLEFLGHLREDLPAVREALLGGHERLTAIEFGAGDSHRRGRSVGVVHFGATKVMYKPRDPQADLAFDRLLETYNSWGPRHSLRRLLLAPGKDRLWTEFVPAGIATDEAGADRFAHRLGALTALLYGLHSTDFHFENVLATGEHPVLVDLEALLHVDKGGSVNAFSRDASVAARVLGDSVATIGILPSRIITRTDGVFRAVDVSAVAGHGGQQGIASIPTFVDVGLDTMHVEYSYSQMSSQRNAPQADDGSPHDLIGRLDAFRAGFREAYGLLREHAGQLLAAGGPIERFEQVRARYIGRPTFVYGRLLLQSYHPDFLRDGLDRVLCLSKLLGGHADAADRLPLIRAELAELYDGDIPVFSVQAGTGVLRGGPQSTVLSVRPAPMQAVRQRLAELDEPDRQLQTQIIDYSFLASSIDGQNDRWPGWQARRPAAGVRDGDLVEAAQAVAHDLVRMACRREGRSGWLGLELVDERWWTLGPASLDLYAGLPGIALALSAVGTVAQDEVLLEAAQDAFDQVAHHVVRLKEMLPGADAGRKVDQAPGIGVFGPLAGSMYALLHGGWRHDNADWLLTAGRLLPLIEALVPHDRQFDVVSGGAGALLALLGFGPGTPGRAEADLVAGRVVDRLLEQAVRPAGEDTIAWGGARPQEPPLVGFSHGALGVAVALARYDQRHGDPRVLPVVQGALAYERGYYVPATGDWEDLRLPESGGRAKPMRAWCHGSPGAALGRSLLLEHYGNLLPEHAAVRAELSASVRAVWQTGLGSPDQVSGLGNHSLCHGDVGNLLCLDRAVDDAEPADLGGPLGRDLLSTSWAALVTQGRRDGFWTGVPKGVPTPGLMTGLAGIAWGLARQAAPGQVPDVLSLQPPPWPVDGDQAVNGGPAVNGEQA